MNTISNRDNFRRNIQRENKTDLY